DREREFGVSISLHDFIQGDAKNGITRSACPELTSTDEQGAVLIRYHQAHNAGLALIISYFLTRLVARADIEDQRLLLIVSKGDMDKDSVFQSPEFRRLPPALADRVAVLVIESLDQLRASLVAEWRQRPSVVGVLNVPSLYEDCRPSAVPAAVLSSLSLLMNRAPGPTFLSMPMDTQWPSDASQMILHLCHVSLRVSLSHSLSLSIPM
ncbi:hypothetical protein KIPB_004799, partial [Kipferlia bialata]